MTRVVVAVTQVTCAVGLAAVVTEEAAPAVAEWVEMVLVETVQAVAQAEEVAPAEIVHKCNRTLRSKRGVFF